MSGLGVTLGAVTCALVLAGCTTVLAPVAPVGPGSAPLRSPGPASRGVGFDPARALCPAPVWGALDGRHHPALARPEQRGYRLPGTRVRWGDPSLTWRPSGPLPPGPDGRPTLIVYPPHADDETLSMGSLIVDAVARGERVIVVGMTNYLSGRTIDAVDARLARSGMSALPPDAITAAREQELACAARALGVAPQDFFLAHLDASGSDAGEFTTVAEAKQVMALFAARYPGATHVAMSFTAEENPDHLAGGIALAQLYDAKVVKHALWTVSRLWWDRPSPPRSTYRPESTAARDALLAAAHYYRLWDPASGWYAMGWTSVTTQFDALVTDPRTVVHGRGVHPVALTAATYSLDPPPAQRCAARTPPGLSGARCPPPTSTPESQPSLPTAR